MMARFSVLTRLKEHENSNLYSKMRVYDGESLKDTDPNARTVQEYRDAAGVTEGMDGSFHSVRLQDPLGDFQFRYRRSGRRSGSPDVCPGEGDPPRAAAGGYRKTLPGIR